MDSVRKMSISVVVPFYNLERYAGTCLDSVAAALDAADGEVGPVEVLCIDDGSTDSTGAILDEYAAKDPRFNAIHKPNGGEGFPQDASKAEMP